MRITRILPTSKAARIILSTAVLAGLVAVGVITAGATGGQTEDPFGPEAQSYAEDFGVTVNEARRRLGLQEEIGQLDSDLSAGEASTFAGLWIQHEPKFSVIVKFTQDGENTILPYVDGGNLEDLVQVGTAQFTMQQLETVQAGAIEAADQTGVLFEAGINVFENRAELYATDAASLNRAIANEGLSLPAGVQVIEVSNLSEPATDIYGGLHLDPCTSGFAVEDDTGTKGITTAGHCDNDVSYNGTDLDFEYESWGGSADVQWHTKSGFTVENKIRRNKGGSTRNITGIIERDDQPISSYVCKYGKITFYGCGQIVDKSYRPTTTGCPGGCNWNATFIKVRASNGKKLSEKGDSGGPFYSGYNAWGTMRSKIVVTVGGNWVRNDAVYMPVDYIGLMDVDVLTN